MIEKLLIAGAAASIKVFGLIGKAVDFFQVYGNNPPAQGATWPDLGPYFNLMAIIVGILSIAYSIYFFYHDRLEMSVKAEKSIDLKIIISEITRYKLSNEKWTLVKNRTGKSSYKVALLIIFSALILLVSYSLKDFLLDAIYIITILLGFVSLQILRNRNLKLGDKPEESVWWVMDHAEMSVSADYNYLLSKAYWSLKQMQASGITIGNHYTEGILHAPPHFCNLKATINPKQNEKDTFTIKIESTISKIDQFTKGKYINRFLDLMGSDGFGPKNHD